MGLSDSINPRDDILSRLSEPRAAEELPRELLCPSGHRTYRVAVDVRLAVPDQVENVLHIPVWVCPQCMVGYRYGECTLPPGEEGLA